MLARSAGMRPAYIATEACMANVQRAYSPSAPVIATWRARCPTPSRPAIGRRLPHRRRAPEPARRGRRDDPRERRDAVPPNTVVRLAFQAVPPIAPGETPGLFGTGTSIRHPLPAREEYFYLDATIADGKLDVDLPPGNWLPQLELDPAGAGRTSTSRPACARDRQRSGRTPIELPALAFVPVT